MKLPHMNRRHFLKGSTALFALTSIGAYGFDLPRLDKTYRVGLIGTGWYGRSDRFRLIQVAAVEVVALADPEMNMLEEAATLVSQRQASKKKPQPCKGYRKMLADHP